MVTRSATVPEHRPPPQPALADIRASIIKASRSPWSVADSLDRARDAVEAVRLEIDANPAAGVRLRRSGGPGAAESHPETDSNVMLRRTFGGSTLVRLQRPTGGASCSSVRPACRWKAAPCSPTTIRAEGSLTVFQSGQVPHQMQDVWAGLLGLPLHRVRVVCPDVGGAFGIKLHAYADELAVVAASSACSAGPSNGRRTGWNPSCRTSMPGSLSSRPA